MKQVALKHDYNKLFAYLHNLAIFQLNILNVKVHSHCTSKNLSKLVFTHLPENAGLPNTTVSWIQIIRRILHKQCRRYISNDACTNQQVWHHTHQILMEMDMYEMSPPFFSLGYITAYLALASYQVTYHLNKHTWCKFLVTNYNIGCIILYTSRCAI